MSRPKRPRDPNQLAKMIVDIATGDAQDQDPDAGKNPHAVALGRLGGLKGGKARAEGMSAKKRSKIAQKAAIVRWKKDQSGKPRYSTGSASSAKSSEKSKQS